MSQPDRPTIRCHEDADLFRESVIFTAAETSFPARLIEKDYFCSVLLDFLAAQETSLVFKGGTCLTKVFAKFYRLSEDLDFSIHVEPTTSRSERARKAASVKKTLIRLPALIPIFREVEPLTGANNSTHYSAVVEYASLLSRRAETIKIEVGLREPLLTPVLAAPAATLLMDPISGTPVVAGIPVSCLSRDEAFAEKFHAALSRREVAIRDFFDIDYATQKMGLQHHVEPLPSLLAQKLKMPGNAPVDLSQQRFATLQRQLDSQLKPVLREIDFREFDLKRAFQIITKMANLVASTPQQ